MRFWALLVFCGVLGGAATAETVLVCHSQELPATDIHPNVESALVETVFDYLFNQGEVAFDLLDDTKDSQGDTLRLKGLAKNYGADRVVWFHLIWKAGDNDLTLTSLVYRVMTSSGQTLAQGHLDGNLVLPSATEKTQLKALQEAISARVKAAW
ncbi:MAG: hypothetical protein HKM05_01905 [Spirochaetales bacterium]|nr:hypothetical protein [Spirochaetales bacterium]